MGDILRQAYWECYLEKERKKEAAKKNKRKQQ